MTIVRWLGLVALVFAVSIAMLYGITALLAMWIVP